MDGFFIIQNTVGVIIQYAHFYERLLWQLLNMILVSNRVLRSECL